MSLHHMSTKALVRWHCSLEIHFRTDL
jgi:hypothetical protein